MSDDADLSMIVHAANMPMEDAGTELVRVIVNYSLAIGYSAGVRPHVISMIACMNVSSVLRESLTPAEWERVQMQIANLLEQQAHEEAA